MTVCAVAFLLIIHDLILLDKYELYLHTRGPSAVQNTKHYAISLNLRLCAAAFVTVALILDITFVKWFLSKVTNRESIFNANQYGSAVCVYDLEIKLQFSTHFLIDLVGYLSNNNFVDCFLL
jgi:hypothetical protein